MNSANGYGWLAQFKDTAALLAAVKALRASGHVRLEAYTPFPVDGLADALALPRSRLPLAMLVGGIVGGCGTLALQYYAAVIDYPIDVGGRPDASWPAFIPAALEMTVLFAVLAGVIGMLIADGLPRLRHPLFASTSFDAATRDGLFVLVRADDPRCDREAMVDTLTALGAILVERVPW